MLDQTVTSARTLQQAMPDPELARLVDELVELRPTLKGLAPQPIAVDRGHGKVKGLADPDMTQPGTVPATSQPEPALSPASARGVRASHEHAFKVLHGG
jgi:hypothetical protein